jgi:16S rRNA processing protein RimM
MPGSKGDPEKRHAREPAEYLVIGRVVRPHGVRGALLVEPISRVIDSLMPGSEVFLGEQNIPVELVSIRHHRERLMLSFSGISDRSQAETFRGQELKIRFSQAAPLDQDEYYYWQILGLEVVLESGEQLGTVAEIIETGANDVYIIRDEAGKEILLPAIASVILKVDLEQEKITVRLMPGLEAG